VPSPVDGNAVSFMQPMVAALALVCELTETFSTDACQIFALSKWENRYGQRTSARRGEPSCRPMTQPEFAHFVLRESERAARIMKAAVLKPQ
jgi:hypothetical protein